MVIGISSAQSHKATPNGMAAALFNHLCRLRMSGRVFQRLLAGSDYHRRGAVRQPDSTWSCEGLQSAGAVPADHSCARRGFLTHSRSAEANPVMELSRLSSVVEEHAVHFADVSHGCGLELRRELGQRPKGK